MRIKCLVDNVAKSETFGAEHGLSLYIETKRHRILFDLGASRLFAENAEKMSLDLQQVDSVVLSHGHFDHGGGLGAFLELNQSAAIYVHHKAFEKHFSKRMTGELVDIGLAERLKSHEQLILVNDHYRIDDDLLIFSGVSGSAFLPAGNQTLFMEGPNGPIADDFSHEQNLLLKEDGKWILIAGCAHRGIANIMERAVELTGEPIDFVIGGFHMHNRSTNESEPAERVKALGHLLGSTNAMFYTGHCTGLKVYKELKSFVGDKIAYLAAGDDVELF